MAFRPAGGQSLLGQAVPALAGARPISFAIGNEAEGAPYVQVGARALPGCLSLSHRENRAAAAWTSLEGLAIGIDLELVEPRQPVFVQDYFSGAEAGWVSAAPAAERDRLVTLIWSAKEAALKALRKGLRLDTRAVEILRIANSEKKDDWEEIGAKMTIPPYHSFRIWYRDEGQFVLTLALLGGEGEVTLKRIFVFDKKKVTT